MSQDIPNENGSIGEAGLFAPDHHGQAAMLVVESLIHGLVAQSVLTLDQAIEIVELDAEVKYDTG